MYNWRSMSPEQREYVLARRKLAEHPWHSPPHRMSDDAVYHLTAANYEHRPILGLTPERMSSFESELLSAATSNGETIIAWCLLPNHYHLLLDSPNVLATLASLGPFCCLQLYQL